MAYLSLTPEEMEATRVARFNKLQTYQRQNLDADRKSTRLNSSH